MSYSRFHLHAVTSNLQTKTNKYWPSLDGIRAIAIIAVLLFHGGLSWIAGGFLGVDVFFVLSGYLITKLLIEEWQSRSSISIVGFYKRRMRRLLPALMLMIMITSVCASLFMQDVAQSTVRDAPWALTGLSNWWFILHRQSYFEVMGRPAPFQHTWSLAVEFQYYWIWPLLLAFVLPLFGEIGICAIALACAGLSTCTLFLVTSTSHAYFGTDTHSLGLFLGAALAAGTSYLSSRNSSPVSLPALVTDTLGAMSIAGLIFLFYSVGERTDTRYRVGLCLSGLSTVILIIAATSSNRLIERFLSAKPLRWMGERSYSIYVWHWPVFQATRPGIDLSLEGTPDFLLRTVLTLGIAEASYRYIETPVRQGAWKLRTFLAAGVLAAAVVGAAGLYETSTAPEPVQPMPIKTIPAKETAVLPAHDSIPDLPTLLVGDSVLLSVSPYVKRTLNVIGVDATIGRQALEVRQRIEDLEAGGQLPATVILDLGNNGVVDERTLRAILEALKTCKHVVVINARVPRPWQDANNALMARIVPTYPNAVIADWHAASEGHREYFTPDGIHAKPRGAQAYADTIVAALHTRKPAPTP